VINDTAKVISEFVKDLDYHLTNPPFEDLRSVDRAGLYDEIIQLRNAAVYILWADDKYSEPAPEKDRGAADSGLCETRA
jgi:hypothetical protein